MLGAILRCVRSIELVRVESRWCRCRGVALLLFSTAASLPAGSSMASSLAPVTAAEDERRAESTLRESFPGARVRHEPFSRVTSVFGQAMSEGDTVNAAVGRWFADFGTALRVREPELQEANVSHIGTGDLIVVTHKQFIDGVPVENGITRTLVRTGSPNRVVYVGSRLVDSSRLAFRPDLVDADTALDLVHALPASAHLVAYSRPTLVILYDHDATHTAAPIRAWRIQLTGSMPDMPESFTIFVSAATGECVEIRDDVCRGGHGDRIQGSVVGYASPGLLPDVPSNPSAPLPVPNVSIETDATGLSYTSATGVFSLRFAAREQVHIRTELVGEWVTISDSLGSIPHRERTFVLPSDPVEFVFNESPSEFSSAQLNAFIHATGAHNFYGDRQPDFHAIDTPILCKVNTGGGNACGAAFDPRDLSIVLTRSTDSCTNSAYSTVVTHEYGHYIVNRLGIVEPQGTFGEGFADTLSILMYDDPVVGRDLHGPGTIIRDAAQAKKQYPCLDAYHACGQVLAGLWWDLKLNLQHSLGDAEGLRTARQLFTNWSRVTLGGTEHDSAIPQTVVELLVVDDDDDDLRNLTPHSSEICSAADAHNLPCPIVDCNNSGLADDWDIETGASQDCTANGIPDECEPDCNDNGDADSCDIANGHPDDDANGVPDDCQALLHVPSVDFPDIQSAIDSATMGDTVLVASGLYTGFGNKDLDLSGKILTLTCETPRACVIDCEGDGRGLYLHSRETRASVVDGFVIRDGSPREDPLQGGGVYCFDSSPTIRNCVLMDNRTSGAAGGLWSHYGNPLLENCVIAHNQARSGGGLAVTWGQVSVHHCTITNNMATNGSTAALLRNGMLDIQNSILWDNGYSGSGVSSLPGNIAIRYSLTQSIWPGPGNISTDPNFADPLLHELQLATDSPAINAGDPAHSNLTTTDAAGADRIQGCRTDMGAFESTQQQDWGDFHHDHRVDLRDIAFFQLCDHAGVNRPPWKDACRCVFDVNVDGTVDAVDFASLQPLLTSPR